jgi:anti-sigma-K factor RskA
MGAAEATTPPPALKARVLAAAERTPQQPPRSTPAVHEVAERRSRRPRRRTAWLAAAAAAAVVVTGGVIGVQVMRDEDPTLAAPVSQVFEAADARTATVSTENGGKLTVGVSPSRNEMAVDTRDLPELDEGQDYQLWAIHGDQVVSVGVLEDIGDGASMDLPEQDTTVALTIEPDGGSDQPTSDPIVQVDPRAV